MMSAQPRVIFKYSTQAHCATVYNRQKSDRGKECASERVSDEREFVRCVLEKQARKKIARNSKSREMFRNRWRLRIHVDRRAGRRPVARVASREGPHEIDVESMRTTSTEHRNGKEGKQAKETAKDLSTQFTHGTPRPTQKSWKKAHFYTAVEVDASSSELQCTDDSKQRAMT